ncbi:GNAT family N-acetyltransferase [Corallococcus aberystwythensis]|uniref:GNAT family N-acetyltransferase n=1 Tax=Corallococcus aberystwythensis TaxID=2316722 RepID=A0A3A8PRL3_9BACT|nr:GNAT family N-acetyltransferase [Corallococcus aberystwythensis]RKH56325.1 GNAT family N-acetyltransferase [Corallococcus aberystwythensis]
MLVPDAGAAALSEQYFRSEHHLRAEGVTHTLVIQTGTPSTLRIPLIVRAIEGTPYRDAISPYGFPGGVTDGWSEMPALAVDWQGTELVSIFVRERVQGPHCFSGGTARNEVFLVDPCRPLTLREMHRRHMRRNVRLGFVSTVRAVRDALPEERAGFRDVYRQTMVRDEACRRYFFSDAYFEELFASPVAWLVTARAPEGAVASAAVVVRSDGLLHYYLGGTADVYLARSPAKNVFGGMIDLCLQLGLPLHLGGGLQPGDGLEDFKRGFANASGRLHTHEIVCDAAAYAALSDGHPGGGFFPAYRAPHRQ